MRTRPISEAPKDGVRVLVTDEGRSYGPFYVARFLHGHWVVEGTGNGTIYPHAWLDVSDE